MRRLLVAICSLALGGLTTVAEATPGVSDLTTKEGTFYVLQAHVDDEIDGWGLVAQRSPKDYIVWVVVTRGRTTVSCETAAEAASGWDPYWDLTFVEGMGFTSTTPPPRRTGPFRYQGPDSPVGEPHLSERDPYGDPWQGKGSDACGDARTASWHWFLDEMAAHAPAVHSMNIGDNPWADDDYQGQFCPPGEQWNGSSSVALKQTGCVQVWADSNGARVVLDLPEMAGYDPPYIPPVQFTPEDVADAFSVVRSRRADWGIPALPEKGVLTPSHYAVGFSDDGGWPDCRNYAHPEHKAVSDAVRYVDLDVGPQYGAAICDKDPYLKGAETIAAPMNPAAIVATNLVVLVDGHEHRVGPYVKNYGWLMPTYGFAASDNFFWKTQG